MSAHLVDHPGHQPYPMQQTHFTTPHQHQPQHQQQSTTASPQPQYYHAQDHANGYTNTQAYVNPQQAYTVPPTSIQQHSQATPTRASMIPPQSVTQETYQSPVIAQPGSDWAKDLIKQARGSELKKHSLTLQLHTAQILSAHSSLEQRNKKLEDVRAQKDWLESERARLLDELRKVNEEREKASVDLSESALQREVNEFKIKIKSITEGEYGGAKKEVEKIRKELGMAPLPSLQVTLEEKGARGFIPYTSVFGVTDAGSSHAGSILKRRLEQSNQETTTADAESPAVVPSLMIQAGAPASGTAPVKRGPGRPRKIPIDVGGDTLPGSSVAESGEDGPSPAKRPRGRPKGSKNKPKAPLDPSNA